MSERWLRKCTLVRRVVMVLIIVGSAGLAQISVAQATFDVASIRPSTQSVAFEHDGETTISHGTLSMHDVMVSTCIKWAYQVQQPQIVGVSTRDQQHYDILAKTSPDATLDQMRVMMQTLLKERFKLAFHHEKRDLNAYAMVVAKSGVKIHPSVVQDGELVRQNSATGMFAKNMSMKQFGDYISDPLGAPLVDETHLEGNYDLRIDFTPYVDQDRAHQPDAASILNAALQGDLGLQLVKHKEVVDVVVIDHVEAPSEN